MDNEEGNPINFYKKDAEYGYFSNLYKSPFQA